MDEARSTMIDVAFALAGDVLPREHRRALADALAPRLPGWPTRRAPVCTTSMSRPAPAGRRCCRGARG
ncbi:MAG: hypothetical protein IPP87_23235 [Ideonella sp.]|nr:hypothetical protein [Ideonella sp.]